jgi:hypothetical protein
MEGLFMSTLKGFFQQNAVAAGTEEFIVSSRFLDDKGKPLSWVLRTMTEAENEAIRKSASRQVKGKNGLKISETDSEAYISKLAVASVTYPNLSDSELQQSYGVMGADTLLRTMLMPGEYAALIAKVQEINGFNRELDEMVDDVKN